MPHNALHARDSHLPPGLCHLTYGAFDAVGASRSDSAETLNYNLSDPKRDASIDFQRIAVDAPGLHDDTSTVDTGYANRHSHVFVAFNAGVDRGSDVADPGLAGYSEFDGGLVDQNTTAVLSLQKVGAYFNPADGYVAQPDISGYFAVYNRTLNFSPSARLHDIALSSYYGRFHDRFGRTDQTNAGGQIISTPAVCSRCIYSPAVPAWSPSTKT